MRFLCINWPECRVSINLLPLTFCLNKKSPFLAKNASVYYMTTLHCAMKRILLYTLLLVLATASASLAQSRRPGKGKPTPGKTKGKSAPKVFAPLSPITNGAEANGDDEGAAKAKAAIIRKVKIDNPVLVFYHQASPGQAAQQLVMDEEDLVMLRYLTPDQLLARRDVYVDGLSNLALPGSNDKKYRLLGTSGLATGPRLPAGDNNSFYVKMKIPSPGFLYIVQESAEEYRHFVKGTLKQGALLDFQVNGLPGVDSLRAVYTLRRVDSAERGAGEGATIR